MHYLGVNFDTRNITAGVVNQKREIIAKSSIPTLKYRDVETILKDTADLCRKVAKTAGLNADTDIEYIGIGTHGTVDRESGCIIYSNYFNYRNVPVCTEIRKYIDLPVYLENDAICYALAESHIGSTKGYPNSVLITLGNAINSGIIINGGIYHGAFYGAGEIGHHVIVHGGEQCECGRNGCWAAYASTTALVRDSRIKAIRYPQSELFKMVNGDIRAMTYNIPFVAAKTGDEWAREVVSLYVKYVSIGLINIINILQPDAIAVGGKMRSEGDLFINSVADLVANKTFGQLSERKTKIMMAELDYDAVIIGATMLGYTNN